MSDDVVFLDLNEAWTIEYRMGYDSVVSGANTTNCNFRLFATKEQTREWERGARDARSAKAKETT